MDFNAILKKLRDIEPTNIADPNAEAPKADTKAPVVLSEAAQLRVKAGISTVLEESKKVEEAKVEMCPEACCGKPVTECKCGPDCEHCDCHAKNAAMKESVGFTDDEIRELCHTKDHDCATVVEHPEWGKGKPVYESHAIPTDDGHVEWYDVEFKHGIEKKVPANEMKIIKMAEHGGTKKKKAKKEDAVSKTDAKKNKKFDEEVDEILKSAEAKLVKEAKKKPDENNNGIPDYAEDGKGKNDLAKGGKKPAAKKDAKKGGKPKKGVVPPQFQKKSKKNESVVATKKVVAESMSFLDAIKIVKESNGEMKVYAVDTAIWNWAKRVAASKVTEGGVKQEAYAAKVYEGRGGVWDVSKTVISE